jgi:hypothetical protein
VGATSAAERRAIQDFGTVVVVGGGCYGDYYLRQLGRAAAAGAVRWRRLLVVDRDPGCAVARRLAGGDPIALPAMELVVSEWAPFFDSWLASSAVDPAGADRDAVVPSPLMPHLLFDWLLARARRRWPSRSVGVEPLQRAPDTPWQRAAPDGTHFVSFAEWMCPINCIEPAKCPHVRAERTWSLPVTLRRYAAEEQAAGTAIAGAAVFHCTHRVYGVGMVDVRDVLEADREVARLGAAGPFELLVGTVSHCHGALNRLVVGPEPFVPVP